MKNRILILGASGFIGNMLYKELQSYFQVFGTYCSQKASYFDNQAFLHYDMENTALLKMLEEVSPSIVIYSLKGAGKAQLHAMEELCSYVKKHNCTLFFISCASVFDAKGDFPSFENDAPLALSEEGKLKIALEKQIRQLPQRKYTLLRLPLIVGVQSPIIRQLREAIKHHAAFEVFPNLIVSANTHDKVAQQVHYIINKELCGIFHLSTEDVIHHDELFREISEKLSGKLPIFKNVYSSNEDQFLAILPRENKLPKNYRITIDEVIAESTLKDEILTLKN